MKKIILLVALSSITLFAQLQILDNFEDGLGHFNQRLLYSGTTKGINDYVPVIDSTTSAYQMKSLKILLIDNPSDTTNWIVRLLSGIGTPSNNVLLNDTGWVGYWLKANRSYVKCGIILDDLNASGSGVSTNEVSDSLAVIGDGMWHLYQWNVADSNRWFPFIASGNGRIQDPVTIDAIMFYALNSAANADTATVYLDYVIFDQSMPLPVELVSFDAVIDANQVDLRWITASELNNKGFEIERRAENGNYSTIGFIPGKGTFTGITGYTFRDVLDAPGTYLYQIKQIDFTGEYIYSKEIEVEVLSVPGKFALGKNYPNPFNPTTRIKFAVPYQSFVNLSVFTMLGEKVATIVNEIKNAGEHEVEFDATHLVSGTYIYTLQSEGKILSGKMILMK